MTVPTVPASQFSGGSTTTIVPTSVADQAIGDLGIIFVESFGTDPAPTLSGGSGFGPWTTMGTQVQGGTRLTVFYAFLTSVTTTWPTVSDTTDHQNVANMVVRGADQTTPIHGSPQFGTNSPTSTTVSIVGTTTGSPECLAVFACACDLPDSTATDLFSAPVNGDVTNIVERVDASNTVGNGGAIGVWTATKTSAGSCGTLSATQAQTAVRATVGFAIQPPQGVQTTTYIRPNGVHSMAMAAAPSGNTTTNVNEVVIQPDAPDTSLYVEETTTGAAEWSFDDVFWPPDMVATSIKFWVYLEAHASRNAILTIGSRAGSTVTWWEETIPPGSVSPTGGWHSIELSGEEIDLIGVSSLVGKVNTTAGSGTTFRVHAAYMEITHEQKDYTRFYLSKSNAAAVSPAFDALWDNTGSAIRRRMNLDHFTDSSNYYTSIDITKGDNAAPWDVLVGQWISDPVRAQLIDSDFKAVIMVGDGAALDAVAQITAKVVSNDGSTVRGVLYAGDTSGVLDELPSAHVPCKFPRAALWPVTVNPVTAQEGDRIVVEIGYRATAANQSGVSKSFYIGDRDSVQSNHDLPTKVLNSTSPTGLSWVQFAQKIIWKPDTANPTKFYFGKELNNPGISGPAFSGSWDRTPGIRTIMRRTRKERRMSTVLDQFSHAGAAVLRNVAMVQALSYPLDEQTISGTVNGQFHLSTTSLNMNIRSQCLIKVVSNDGTALRGTLLAVDNATALSADNEWHTTNYPRKMPVSDISPATLTPVDCDAGDRICVEMGYRGQPTAGWTAFFNLGDTGVSGEIPAQPDGTTSTDTVITTMRGWLEFSQGLIFEEESFDYIGSLATGNPIMMLV